MAFQTKITRARFVLGPFSSEQMATIGEITLSAVKARIQKGVNVNDAEAKPLKPGRPGRRGYPDYKTARGLQPIRDLTWRGKTMRSLQVLSANENRVVIGPADADSARILHFNNQIDRMWGISPNDRKALTAAVSATVKQARVVRVARSA